MTTSLAQKDCLTTSSSIDTITLGDNSYISSMSSNTIDLSTISLSGTSSTFSYGAGSPSTCYTFNTTGSTNCRSNISTITGIDMSGIWSTSGEEWIHRFPDWARVEDMCKEYPGLAIAFEKFKTVYKLVADDYDTPKDKRAKP